MSAAGTDAAPVDIVLERETANDESGLVVAIHFASGTQVAADDLLFEIENSKVTQEIRAPRAGVLTHALHLKQQLGFGIPIARIGAAGQGAPTAPQPPAPIAAVPPPSAPARSPAPPRMPSRFRAAPAAPAAPPQTPRTIEPLISDAARRLLAEHALDPAIFDADFITTAAIRARLGQSASAPASAPAPAPVLRPAAANGQPVSGRKQIEIDSLSQGAGATMLSVLGTSLGDMAVQRPAGDFLTGRIIDLVLYEAARLVRKFPRLNGYYADGDVHLYDRVHAGLAIDGGGRLVVYGIEDADKADLAALSDTIMTAVARYADNTLKVADLSRATFTVTDLSADELDFVLPLLPRGQSLIIGITHAAATGFRLFAGFDHRVTEGREVAAFLGELRQRLASYAAPASVIPAHVSCTYCDRSLTEAVTKNKGLGLLKIIGRDGREALCCTSCWNGW